jgi:type VI secretion system secreted protein Hcp
MKTLRKHAGASGLAVILGLAALAAIGGVGLPGVAPSAAVWAAVPGGTSPMPQAVDMFLKIEGVDGEVTAAAHKGWIEVLSWSWGLSQAGSGGAGAGGAVGRLVGHVTIVKRVDKATPPLFKRCSDGTVLPLVTMELARSGGGLTYLKYDLNSVLVSSIAHGDVDGDGIPDETIMLDFTGAKLTYTQLDASGKPVGVTLAEGESVPVLP